MSFNLQRFHYIPESVTHFTQELPSAARVHSLTFSTLADVEIDLQFMLRTCFASGLVISSTIWWGGGRGEIAFLGWCLCHRSNLPLSKRCKVRRRQHRRYGQGRIPFGCLLGFSLWLLKSWLST